MELLYARWTLRAVSLWRRRPPIWRLAARRRWEREWHQVLRDIQSLSLGIVSEAEGRRPGEIVPLEPDRRWERRLAKAQQEGKKL